MQKRHTHEVEKADESLKIRTVNGLLPKNKIQINPRFQSFPISIRTIRETPQERIPYVIDDISQWLVSKMAIIIIFFEHPELSSNKTL